MFTWARSSLCCADRRGCARPGNGVPADMVASVKQLVSVSNGMCQRAMACCAWWSARGTAGLGSTRVRQSRGCGRRRYRELCPAWQARASAHGDPHRGRAAEMLPVKDRHAWVLQLCTLSCACTGKLESAVLSMAAVYGRSCLCVPVSPLQQDAGCAQNFSIHQMYAGLRCRCWR